MWRVSVEFESNIYYFRSDNPNIQDIAYRMWELFDFKEDTCYYLDNMIILKSEKIN